jgi:hypothetical protein
MKLLSEGENGKEKFHPIPPACPGFCGEEPVRIAC